MGILIMKETLISLIKKGVRLSVAQDKLIVDGNISSIDPETKLFIKDNRDAIIRFILDRDKTSQQRIPKRDQSQPAPLSYSQQRLWFLDQLNGGSSQYNMSAPYRICGTPNLEVVQQAIDTIVARHEVLRTLYLQDEQGIALQQIQAAGRVDIQKLDFSACEEQEQLTRVRHFALEETQKPFDLAKNWPIRVSLIRLAEQEHVLVITMHHIASDGWSAAVLTNEFTALYVAYLQGMPCPLPALPVQYADYAAWQRKQLTASQLEQKIGYWTDLLADLPTLHSLPLDKPRAKVKSDTGAMYPQHLDKTLLFRLNKICKEQDVTLFMLLQAGFALLLSRFSLESDIVIGSPVANRPQHELAPLIGFFANTLVFRHDLSGSPLFSEFLQKVKEQALNAYEHQDVPFDMLVDRLYPQRTLSYSPLFQIMFILQNNQSASLELPGLTLSPLTYEQALARFDLSLSMEEGEDGLQANWSFSSDLFEWQTVDCMARSFETLLQSIVDGVHQPVDRLKLVPQEDRARLEQWNQTTQEIPEGLTVKQCFEQQVLRSSLQTAVISEGQELNYLQLNEQANRVANFILAQGLGQDDFVAVCLPRGLELVIAMLGVIKAGACYQPLDPGFPDARLLYMMEDSSSELLLTDATNAIRFSSQTNAVEIRQILSGQQAELSNPAVDPQSDSLAYVVYTSGSTGRPKGVMIEHGSLSNFLYWFEQLCPLNESDTSLLKAVNSVDVSIWEILRPLCAGARLVIAKPEGQKDPVYLQQLISTYSITNLHLIPGMLNALLDAMDWQQCKSLRFVSCGGEPLSADTANRFYSSCSEARLYNFFGLSEATIDVCAFACSDPMPDKAVPIGLPVSNTRLHLLSNSGQIQPVGAIGELFIGGLSLARGYVNLADLTAERFVTLSIDGGAPEALYRTGDLVRRRADGHLVYIGRADQQVKIRGFRVELQDIEVALKALPSVKTAVVTANLTENGTTSLAAYVVPDEMDTESLDKEHFRQQIKDLLSEQLPVHMLPGHYHVLDALPLTPNGKVDRRALPALEHESPQSYAAPRTEVEMQLCELWQQLLGRERVGVTDNFFSLGGDSILSIQLVSRAARLGLKMSVRHLFDHQTIGELSRHVVQERGVVVSQEAVSGQQVLLPMQRRFLQGEATEQWHYNQSVLLAVPEGMEVAQLRTIVTGLYQRHDALRLRFSEAEGVWQGRYDAISPALIEQSLGELLLNGQSQSEWEAELGRQGGEIQRQLSLSDGPLFRAVLMRGEAGRNRLLLVIHHLLVDGLSWRVLLQDVATGYAQSSRAEQVRLDGKSSSLQQWGQFLEAYAHSAELGAEREYWLSQLQTPVEELEAQFSREADRSLASTEQVLVSLDAEQTAALLSDCHSAYHTQINDVLLSAVLLGLRHWAGLSSVQIDLEGHGREDLSAQLDLSETLGWFTSLYPVVLQCVGEGALGETLKGVKEALRRVPHKGLGYGVLRYMAEDDAICAAERRGSVLFNYLGQFDQSLDEESGVYPTGEFAGWTESPARQRQYLLSINGMVVEGCLRMSLDYNRHSYSSGSMELLATEIMAALQALISHCSEPGAGSYTPSDFPLAVMSQAELDEWQGDYPHLTRIYPSTPMQRGLLFHSELSRSAYVTQIAMDIVSGMDVGKFKQACQAVVARHEIFRTAFVGEHRHQLVLDEVLLNWFEADWTAEPDRAEAMYCAHRELDKQRGFEATEAPLMRVSLLRLSGGIYRFLWSSHHALLDGWSLSRVMGEILQSYEALVAGRAAELPAAAAYEDYIRWLAVQDKAKAQAYWREALQGVTEVTRLGGLEKVGGQGSAGENRSQNVQLNAERSGRLQQLAQQHKVTLNTVMQSAWAYLLYRYSGERRVVFGETIAGRPGDLPGVEQMAGLFINSVPVSVDVGEASSLGSWLEQMHRSGIERSEYGYLSLADIQQMSGLGHGQSLFDSLVVFENYPMDAAIQARPKGEGLQVENLQNEEQTHYGLTLVVVPGTEIGIVLHYNAGRYGDEDMTRLLGHYGRILDGMAAEPAGEVRALPMMTEPELRHVLFENNATQMPSTDNPGIYARFENFAALTPNAVAVEFNQQKLTYAELNRKANQLAHFLLEQGVGPNSLIGLCLERSIELVIGILGVLKAGAAYVTLDPAYPAARLDYMLNDANVPILLTQAHLPETIRFDVQTVYCLDAIATLLDTYSDANPGLETLGTPGEDLAYVLYTSGSTGQPKGVMIRRGSLITLIDWLLKEFSPQELRRVLCSTSINFDLFVFEFWSALSSGNCLVLVENILTLVTQPQLAPSLINTVPSAVRALLDEGSLPSSVKVLNVAGEPLKKSLVNAAFERSQVERVINLYGPSEDTTYSTYAIFTGRIQQEPTIGRPIGNTQAYVLSDALEPVPVGVEGELHLAGDGLAKGYLNRPELTAQKFIDNPFTGNGKMYKTGDLVKWLPDGTLAFIGRKDHQIKLRGFRIELSEIENRLLAHEDISDAVAVVDEPRKQIVMYLVSHSQCKDCSYLDAYLRQFLPSYMLPGHYHVLDALPLTPNGKVDRRALPALEHESPQSYAAPRTEVEMQLCELWQQLLGRERVGVTDNFFSLGGDSILSIQLVSRAARLGLKMSVRHLFDHQTIGELSRHVVQERGVVVSQEAVSGQQVLLPMQRRFLQGEATEQWHYNQSVLLAVPEGMEVAQLRTIVTGLYQRHDALRLRFSEAEGVWQGRYDAISPALIEQSLGELLLNGQSQSEWEAELGRQGGEIQRQLSLSDGPLFRAVLMRGEAGRNRLLLVIHHLLVDGLSWRVLLQDVATGYAQSSRAEQVRLDGKSSSLQQWGQFLEAYAHSAELGAEREYWLSQLQTPVEELEAQFSREADRSLASTEQVLVSLDAEQTAALLSDCHSAYHTQINDVLLSAVLLGLRHWAGLSSVQIDLEGHGREDLSAQLDLSETLGWFTSLYPVVLQCVGEGALGETLKGVKEALRRVPHKGLGYGVLRYMAEDDAICAAERRGSVLFNYLGQFDQSLDEESGVYPTGEFAGWTESPARQRQYLLSINGMVVEGCLRMSLDYNRHSYSSGSMELLATEIMAALQALISHCSEPGAGSYTPSDFPLAVMSQAELDEWQGDYPHLTRIYPSTPMQRGLLFHSELSRSAYVTQIAMDIVSGMDVGKFKQACQAVVARHEIFRTAFVGEHRHQLVLDEVLLNWFEADWTAEPDRAEAMYCAHRELDKQRGFEATEAPLMRVSLLRLSGGIYRFLWSSHHALLDGWSLSRVMGEILQSYEALVAGRAAELPAAAAYEDYIRWLAVQDKAKAQAYWREALQGVTEVTRLGGLEKVGGQGSAGENRSQNVQLNAERSGRLQQLAQQHKVTLNTVMQSAWAYLLYRYSGERRVVFGETIAGRPGDLPGVEQMAGLFINSVPVSVDVGEASSLGSWLEQMHRSGIERSEYGYLSLADIQQMSGLGHGQSLFDSLVVFENYPMDAAIQARPKGEGLQVENLQNEEQTHYGLTLVVVPGTEIGIVLHYNAGRYGDEDMTRLLGHYGRILDGMAAEPAGEVRALPMMTEPELQKIATWQAGLLNVSDDRGLWSLFVEQVDNRKEQIAVAHDGLHISYQALYQRAEQIAACLLHNGVRQGDTVGICLPRTPDLIASLLAVVRIGCAYIPLDPNYPQQQLTQMVNNSQVTLIVTISSLQEKMAFAHPVLLDNSLRDLMLPCDAAPDVDAHQLAYVMYTSGSTGVPKGVRVLHKGIIRLVKNNNFMQLDENTVFLQAASVSFDAATLEIWGSLLNGGRLVLYPEDRIDLETMNRVIEEEKVNSLWLTAGLFEQWSHKLPQTRYLRWILAGGDVLDPKSVARVYASYKDVICINGYGPTENTTFTACYPIPRDFDDYQTIPLGRYIAGTWGEVRQTDGFRAGIGMLGELWVAGAGVADGYHNNPQLSEQMFVRDRDGQVFYKTGDLVSYNAQGLLNFFGRSDEQIKIRGFRLELGAILHQLLCHPALQYGTLVVLGQGALKQLVAYVVAKPTNNLDDAALSRELRAWLQTRLPAYMLPQHYVFLDTLPLTANGKVNRQALPPLDVSTLLAHEYVAPATETEAHLCAMWKTLLQLEQVGIRDNFFELGGHSLLATRLKSQIQHDFQLEIPIQELFRLHTVQELGRYIDTENKLNKGLDLSDSILMQGQTNEESETWEL